MSYPDLLFVSYQDSLELLNVDDAMCVCEEVYRMLARGTVAHSRPPSFKLDVAEDFNNHWHVKAALLREIPTTGVRLYNYFDDGNRNTVGALECGRYIVLADPQDRPRPGDRRRTSGPTAFAAPRRRRSHANGWRPLRRGCSASSASAPWRTNTPALPVAALPVRRKSAARRDGAETREAFAAHWSAELGIAVRPSTPSRRWCAAPTSRSAVRPRPRS